jgi:hypothetical protein
MDCVEAVVCAEDNTADGVMASGPQATGVEDPIAFHIGMTRQPLRSPPLLELYLGRGPRMRAEATSRELQTAWEKSDRVVVPLDPGNSGAGKDPTPPTPSKPIQPTQHIHKAQAVSGRGPPLGCPHRAAQPSRLLYVLHVGADEGRRRQ